MALSNQHYRSLPPSLESSGTIPPARSKPPTVTIKSGGTTQPALSRTPTADSRTKLFYIGFLTLGCYGWFIARQHIPHVVVITAQKRSQTVAPNLKQFCHHRVPRHPTEGPLLDSGVSHGMPPNCRGIPRYATELPRYSTVSHRTSWSTSDFIYSGYPKLGAFGS